MITMTKAEARALNPITLAFYGDAFYELLVRRHVVGGGDRNAGELHKRSVGFVRASSQSLAVDYIGELLTEEETEIYKRGRNCNNSIVPKSSNPRDYRRATGLEGLFGYLALTGQETRAEELFGIIVNRFKEEQDKEQDIL